MQAHPPPKVDTVSSEKTIKIKKLHCTLLTHNEKSVYSLKQEVALSKYISSNRCAPLIA